MVKNEVQKKKSIDEIFSIPITKHEPLKTERYVLDLYPSQQRVLYDCVEYYNDYSNRSIDDKNICKRLLEILSDEGMSSDIID